MAEPLTLAAMTSVALVEGIKFLYEQAGELFRRRREKTEAPLEVQLPAALGGGWLTAEPDIAVVERNAGKIASLRGQLSNYAGGALHADPADERLLVTVVELRDLIESALGRHLTFTVEHTRPASREVLVTGRVHLSEARDAQVTGVQVETLTSGTAHGEVQIDKVDGGAIVGGRFGSVGPNPAR